MVEPLIQDLIKTLQCLPGVGSRSARRMTFYLLERNREGALALSASLDAAAKRIGHCNLCCNLTENETCLICQNAKRDPSKLCIVDSPVGVIALERSQEYTGRYFVLKSKLSPIDGIGPKEAGIDLLLNRMMDEDIQEVILAINPTVEGEATSYYITQALKNSGVTISRIANGIPLGGELEFTDEGTLAHALLTRRNIKT